MNILKLHFTKHKRPWRPLLLQLCYNFINKLLPTTVKISPQGLYFSKAFFEGLIFGGAYVQREIWISKSIGLACCGKEIYHFCFVLLCIREQIPCTSAPGEGYIRRGDLTEGFLRYDFEGLIFGILQYVNSLIITNSITQNDWLLFFPSLWRLAFFAAVDKNFPTCCILFFPRPGCLHIPNFFIWALIMPETATK